jgi:3-hydroxyisobutyrate dehydrogenase
MTDDKPLRDTPVGVIGNDDFGPAIATRIAACGHRVLYAGLSGSPVLSRGQRLEPASTTATPRVPS